MMGYLLTLDFSERKMKAFAKNASTLAAEEYASAEKDEYGLNRICKSSWFPLILWMLS